MNRIIMTRANVGMKLIKKILDYCNGIEQLDRFVKLFEVVANYSISVSESKALLRSLRFIDSSSLPLAAASISPRRSSASSLSMPRLSRRPSGSLLDRRLSGVMSAVPQFCVPFYYDSLLKSVYRLAQRKEADLDLFYFSGHSSGLVLPKLDRWPGGSGYSFVTWFKMEEDLSLQMRGESIEIGTPATGDPKRSDTKLVLFSCRNDDGSGVEIAVIDSFVTLSVHKNGSYQKLVAGDLALIRKRWYFLAVCHAAPKLPWYSAPEAFVFINGGLRASMKMDFPEVCPYSVVRVGATGIVSEETLPTVNSQTRSSSTADAVPELEDLGYSNPRPSCFSCFSGQMASVYVMDDVLSLAQLNALYELGPGHSSQFRVEDAASYPDIGNILFDGALFGRILIQLYPTAIRTRGSSTYCFDVGPRRTGDAEMREVFACSTKCLRTAIHALGGIEIMIPLMTHLDYPLGPGPIGSSGWPMTITETPSKVKVARLATFLKIIAVLMGEDAGHMERFASFRGPKILGMLLQQQQPTCLSMKSLDAMITPMMQAGTLIEEIEESLVFDFNIWSVASPSVQVEHVQFLQHFLRAHSDIYRSRFGVIYLMDTLETHHWLTPPDFLPPEVLARLILARQDNQLVSQVRSHIFLIIGDYVMNGGVQPDEFSRIVSSLWSGTRDFGHLNDLLGFLISQCANNPESLVLESFLGHGQLVEVVMWLLYKPLEEKSRVLALRLFFIILQSERTPEKWKKRIRLEEPPLPGIAALGTSMTLAQSGILIGRLLAENLPSRANLYRPAPIGTRGSAGGYVNKQGNSKSFADRKCVLSQSGVPIRSNRTSSSDCEDLQSPTRCQPAICCLFDARRCANCPTGSTRKRLSPTATFSLAAVLYRVAPVRGRHVALFALHTLKRPAFRNW
ncbi:hypothetical protein DFJ73DRAFT_85055 [Zopfochytrium polystomum]|nr:hypothetical protein DFJ73DRAFT_85055 [Zopfochytrium polystomum]